MAGLAKRSEELEQAFEQQHGQQQFEALEVADGLGSPARKLQSYLQGEWADGVVEEEAKWSPRQSAAFVIVTCGLAWAGLWFFVQSIF